MSRSNRGAARVSAIWIIVASVVALATTAFAFISQQDFTDATKKVTAAESAKKTAVDAFQEVNSRRQKVVELLGHYDANSADPVANLEEAKEAIDGLRQTWPDISATNGNYQGAIPAIKAAYNRQADAIATQKSEIERLTAELASRNTALADVTRAKDSKIQDLMTQIADATQNADTRQQELQSTIDDTREAVAANDSALRAAQSEFATKESAFEKEASLNVARNQSLMNDLKERLARDAMRTDGTIQSVSVALGKAWINRGSDNRLSVGTRFDVYGQQGGMEILKAVGQVSRIVDGGMAELSLVTVDNSDPVVVGDRIANPFYDPDHVRKAILVGDFPGKAELIAALGHMNIEVQDTMDLETRMAIIGGPLRVDPETGDALDEELSPQDLDEYKQAVSRNLQLMTVSMLREYFPQSL